MQEIGIGRFLITLILASLPLSQGCVAAAIGYAGYALSSSKDKASTKEVEAANLKTYESYKSDAEKLNLDRQKAGIKTEPVMTYKDWKLAHNIPTPAPEPQKAAEEKKD